MKNEIIVGFLALLLLAVPAMALTAATSSVKAYLILGKGIAASPSDPLDFMIVKFGLGRVITINDTETTIGVLIADDVKYRLKEITIEEGHATGKIYSNGTEVGSFDVSSVMKGDTEIWAGTMELNDKDYNVYVIEGVRPIKAGELKEKVSDYCKNNPDANCAGKIEDYCNNNPEDNRCQALFRAYCLNGNMEDTRCRQAFINWCKENPENKHCVPFALKWAKNYCEEHSDSNLCQKIATNVADFCKNNPENEGCITVKQIVAERPALLSKIQAIRGKIAALKINATLNTTPVVSSDVEGGE